MIIRHHRGSGGGFARFLHIVAEVTIAFVAVAAWLAIQVSTILAGLNNAWWLIGAAAWLILTISMVHYMEEGKR